MSRYKFDPDEKPHIVKDFYDGRTHIMIADNYCVKTKEEVDAILERCKQIFIREYLAGRTTLNTPEEQAAARAKEEAERAAYASAH